MKLLPYIIALLLSGIIATVFSFPVSLVVHWLQAKLYNDPPGFWTGIWLAGIESLILVWFSIWVFSWFNYSLSVLYIFFITLVLSINNIKRYKTRNNKPKELGYLFGQAIGIPLIYYQSLKEVFISAFVLL